ncbi:TlpA family protein disulfide reductase [Fibrella sp. GW2-5]
MAGVIALPPLLICIFLHSLHFSDTFYALPSSLAHFTGIAAGLFLTFANSLKKAVFIPLFVAATIWGTTTGYDFWTNKSFFGTYTGAVNEQISPFDLHTSDGRTVSSASLKGQFVVLDFWNTGCVSCFKKFPLLQEYYTQYGNNSKIKFFAVNIPLLRDAPGQADRIIKKDGYTFPVLLADNKQLQSLFKVNSFPTVIIIDPSQRIIYRGQLDGIDESLRELAEVR